MKSLCKIAAFTFVALCSLNNAWAQFNNSIFNNANQQVSNIISGASQPASAVWYAIQNSCSAGFVPATGSIAVQPSVLQAIPGGMVCSIQNGPNCTMVIQFCANGTGSNGAVIPTQLSNKIIVIGAIMAGTNGNTTSAQYSNLVCASNIITNPLLTSQNEGTIIAPISNSSLGVSQCRYSDNPTAYITLLQNNPNIGNSTGVTP